MCALFSYFHWLTMVAILQLKASKHFVYFVPIAVITFTLLNISLTREYYLMDNPNNTTTSNNTSYSSHVMHTYGRRTADIFQQCSKLIGKSSKSSCHISFLKCYQGFGLIPNILSYKMIVSACVQAGQRKLPDRFVKFFLGVIDSSMEIVRKILKFQTYPPQFTVNPLTQTRTLIIPQLPHRPPKTPLLDPSPAEHIVSVPPAPRS